MNLLWTLVIEFALLFALAGLYYLWQRNKILKNDKADIYVSLTEMITDMKTEASGVIPQEFIKKLEDANESRDYQTIIETLDKNAQRVPSKYSNSFGDYILQIKFHIKSP